MLVGLKRRTQTWCLAPLSQGAFAINDVSQRHSGSSEMRDFGTPRGMCVGIPSCSSPSVSGCSVPFQLGGRRRLASLSPWSVSAAGSASRWPASIEA